MQEPDGSVARGDWRTHVDGMVAAIEALSPSFPHQANYLGAVGVKSGDRRTKPDAQNPLEHGEQRASFVEGHATSRSTGA